MNQITKSEIKSLADFEFSPNWEEREVEFKDKKKPSGKRFIKKNKTKTPKLIFKAVIGNDLLEKIKIILRKDGITRNLSNITKDITEKKLYDLKIEFRGGEDKFIVLNSNNKLYSSMNDLITRIIFSDKINLICEDKFTIDKEFDHVLIEKVTGNVFPPKSYNLFNNLIDVHNLQNKNANDRKTIIENLKISRDKDTINNLKNETFQLCKFQINNDKSFDSIDSLKSVIMENVNSKYYTLKQKVSLPSKEIYERTELFEIKTEFEKFYSRKVLYDINNCLKAISKQLKFFYHNHNKENYICAYQPKGFDTRKLNETSNKLIQNLQKCSNNVGDLISQSENWGIAKTDCLKEIKWLVKSGILRQYESGKIEISSPNKN